MDYAAKAIMIQQKCRAAFANVQTKSVRRKESSEAIPMATRNHSEHPRLDLIRCDKIRYRLYRISKRGNMCELSL